MTAAGRPRCALLMDGAPSMALTASPPNLSAKSPTITCVLRLSSSPMNTFLQKAGLDYTLLRRGRLTAVAELGERAAAAFQVARRHVVKHQCAAAEMAFGEGRLDRRLADR